MTALFPACHHLELPAIRQPSAILRIVGCGIPPRDSTAATGSSAALEPAALGSSFQAVVVPCSGPPPQKVGRKKNVNSWTARLRRFAKFLFLPNKTSHHLLDAITASARASASALARSPVQTPHFQLELSFIANRHPASTRRSQWPEARASRLEARVPAVRRAPREQRSSRATLRAPGFR